MPTSSSPLNEIPGVSNAVNALAISDDGRRAFLLDPRVDAVITVNLSDGTRQVYKWYDKGFHHRRWLCYCLFTLNRDGLLYLPSLFFNQQKKAFCLINFLVDEQRQLLHKLAEHWLSVEPIKANRLAYSAHKDADQIQIIFYERFSRHRHSSELPSDEEMEQLAFVYCSFDCRTMRTSTTKGTLPLGQWELPFIANQSLHFISTERQTATIASRSLQETNGAWNIRSILPDGEQSPPRRALWCNAWQRNQGWFAMCEKFEQEPGRIHRQTNVWGLDPRSSKWKKLSINLDTPDAASNFAFRVTNDDVGFLHSDWNRHEALFHRLQLAEQPSRVQEAQLAPIAEVDETETTIEEAKCKDDDLPGQFYNDVICPICLDTYNDPRTLICGHSICNDCVAQMVGSALYNLVTAKGNQLRCPACRRVTSIPEFGLPMNYSLKEAIENMEKQRKLTEANLRCDRCRSPVAEAETWTCIECFCQPGTGADFCAVCILKYHSDHRITEMLTFRENCKLAKELQDRSFSRIEEIIKVMEKTMIATLTTDLTKQFLDLFDEKLCRICDAAHVETKEMEDMSSNLLSLAEKSCQRTTQDFSAKLQKFVAYARRDMEKDRPTDV